MLTVHQLNTILFSYNAVDASGKGESLSLFYCAKHSKDLVIARKCRERACEGCFDNCAKCRKECKSTELPRKNGKEQEEGENKYI
jgi:hypothetical protein